MSLRAHSAKQHLHDLLSKSRALPVSPVNKRLLRRLYAPPRNDMIEMRDVYGTQSLP